jgi:hypothetical protein
MTGDHVDPRGRLFVTDLIWNNWSELLDELSSGIVEAAQRFKDGYGWFSAIYANRHLLPDRHQFEKIEAFINEGLQSYPNRRQWALHGSAIFTYYSRAEKRGERIWERKWALSFFKRASQL